MNRLEAALWGTAAGDALGFPFEGLEASSLKGVDLSFYHSGIFPAGTWSDDTSLTFLTAESLTKKGGLDLWHLGQLFVRWLKDGYLTPFGKAIGVGRATQEALYRFLKGTPPRECGGKGERDNGNGSLMRMLPVILWYLSEEPDSLLEKVHEASRLTHAHPRSLMACGFWALFLWFLAREKEIKKAIVLALEEGKDFYEKDPVYRDELPHFERLNRISFLSLKDLRPTGYVVHTLETAFWIMDKELPFEKSISLAVSLGGDTDTIASIVGGASGFFTNEIPLRFIEGLIKKEDLEERTREFSKNCPYQPDF